MSLDQKPSLGSAFKLDKYELTREIASSGVATTWAATATDDEKSYVVLRLHRNVTKKADAVEAFLRDAETGKLASHPNVIPVVQTGSVDGEVFVVSEHFDAEALSTLIAQAKSEGLPPAVALTIGRQMLEGLAAAHGASPAVAHAELNPFHVLVGKDGVTRIAGLGWAQALSKFGPHGLLKPDRLAYAAPERVKALSAATANSPTPPFSPTTDVFAAGVILWELLSKQRLFASKMEASVVQKVTAGPIAPLANQANVKVPAAVTEAIHKALERDPAKRPASINDMLEAIRALPEDEFAKAEDVAAVVEKLAAKAATAPAPAAPAAPRAPAARSFPTAPKPAAAADKDGGSPASVRPKAAPLPRAIPARKATLVGGLDPSKPTVTRPDKPSEASGEKSVEKTLERAIPKPPPIGESKRPPPPPPPRASAPPPPPPGAKLGMPKPPTFIAKPETPKPPAVREAIESLAGEEIEIAPDSSPKPEAEAAQAPVVSPVVASAMEKATIPVPAMLAAKAEAAKEAIEAAEKEAAAKAAAAEKEAAAKAAEASAGIEVDVAVSAEVPITDASAEVKAPDVPRNEVTKTAHTPTSHPSASPRDGEDSPHSRPSIKSSALDKLKPRSLLGRYEILMRVAQGGMASVWAARLQGTRGFQKIVAIKTMLPDVSDDPDFETMFLDEARVAARIRHPNVVEIFDLGEQDDVLYLVMEWVEGDTLSGIQKAAKKLGGIPQNITLRIASQVCAGLHAAHELRDDNGTLVDLVHRDISPGNILISTAGFAKVTDFGVAKSAGRLHVTRAEGMVKGKTPYLSPEQLGTLPLDRRSDIFSLGVLLYVMVTGLHPFRGDSEFKTVENIALKDPIPPIQLVPSVHPDLDKLIIKALEKDRTKRFATAAEMQRGLDHVAAQVGDPVTDDDVAGFVRKCLGETITKNASDLRAAIAAADAASADRISITSEAPRPPTDSKPDLGAPAISAGHDATIDVASDGAAAVAAAAAVVSPGGAIAAPFDTDAAAGTAAAANDTDQPKKKKSGAIIGIVAAAAVAAGVLGVVFASSSDDKPAGPTTAEQAAPKESAAAPQETAAPSATAEPAPTEEPKAEEPKEEPKAEEPTAEEPKAEEPKVEEPAPTTTTAATQAPTATATNKTWKPATTGTFKTSKTAPTTTKTTKTTKKTTKYDPGGI